MLVEFVFDSYLKDHYKIIDNIKASMAIRGFEINDFDYLFTNSRCWRSFQEALIAVSRMYDVDFRMVKNDVYNRTTVNVFVKEVTNDEDDISYSFVKEVYIPVSMQTEVATNLKNIINDTFYNGKYRLDKCGLATLEPYRSGWYQIKKWYNDFDIYSGLERRTGKHKTIVVWADKSRTVVYNAKLKPGPVAYAVAYAYAKKRFGSNSHFKKLVDLSSTRIGNYIYCYNVIYGFDASVKVRDKNVDIYDQVAMNIAAKNFSSYKKFNDMITEKLEKTIDLDMRKGE